MLVSKFTLVTIYKTATVLNNNKKTIHLKLLLAPLKLQLSMIRSRHVDVNMQTYDKEPEQMPGADWTWRQHRRIAPIDTRVWWAAAFRYGERCVCVWNEMRTYREKTHARTHTHAQLRSAIVAVLSADNFHLLPMANGSAAPLLLWRVGESVLTPPIDIELITQSHTPPSHPLLSLSPNASCPPLP